MCSTVPLGFSTVIFLDTETTGLPNRYFHPHVTELSLVAVHRSQLICDDDVPRVLNKLNMCFNPMCKISSQAADISGAYVLIFTP